MKFAIACGGTGGHLFPGLAVAEVLRGKGHEVLLFVSEKEIDSRALHSAPSIARETLPSIGMPPLFSPAVFLFLGRLRASYAKCLEVYRKFAPDAVLGMGGFTSIAPLAAAWRRKIPAFLHDSNAIPGKANRLGSRFCRKVLLGFQECAQYFPGRPVLVTGTPIRSELTAPALAKSAARSQLGLDAGRMTVLVMGGSQGAAGINTLMAQAATHLAPGSCQIVHLSGPRDEQKVRGAYNAAGIANIVMPFCDRMGEVYSAADLVVSRSGAASLGELSWFGLPSVLVPYPHAAEDHQRLNAEIFVRADAARMLAESVATGDSLGTLLRSLLGSPATLASMAAAARALAPRDAAGRVAAVLIEVKK